MRVAICDDDAIFLSRLQKSLEAYFRRNSITYELNTYDSGEALLDSNVSNLSIVFMDIKMANLNGIDTAQILRKRNPEFILVFVTGLIEYAPEGYMVKAFRYILKDRFAQVFDACMDDIIYELGIHRVKMSFDFVAGTESVYIDTIIYIESDKHLSRFYFDSKTNYTRHIYERLDKLESQLPSDQFIRIHKSFLVNAKYIEKIANYTTQLTNGVVLPASHSRFQEAKRKFYLYKGR